MLAAQRLLQRLAQAIQADRLTAVQRMGLQPGLHGGVAVARRHVENIASTPVNRLLSMQCQQVGRRALTTWVKQLAARQRP